MKKYDVVVLTDSRYVNPIEKNPLKFPDFGKI